MESMLLPSLLSIFFLVYLVLKSWLQITRKQQHSLPPSPRALPIIGHLHLMKKPIHRTLQSLSQKYGPIMSLRFCSRPVLVLSSPAAVQECFTNNDIIFANRPPLLISKYLNYNCTTLVAANYGEHWRNLRRISAIEIFSSTRLKSFRGIREDEVKILLRKLYHASKHGFSKVGLRSMFMDMTYNIIMRMVAGKRYYGEDVKDIEEAREFKDIMQEYSDCAGMSNLVDFFPVLKWVGCNGFVKRLVRLSQRMDLFMQNLIEEHRANIDGNTMINHLLALQESQPEYYTDEIIKGFVLVMLLGGTKSSSVALEWALSNLLNHPDVLGKAKLELETQVGQDRLVNESDLPNLPYLQMIIHENLRLYPVTPLLVPHMSSTDCTIGGYYVPSGTMLFVNTWAVHRDPAVWEDPTSFKPERFVNGKCTEKHMFLPFGMGRRACPGDGLGNKVMNLALGSLIQCFDWERNGESFINMDEMAAITMCKVEPLEAMCRARGNLNNILVLLYLLLKSRKQKHNLPPSPPALPIIGHLHLMKKPIHRTMQSLSQKYGPIISFRFGSRSILVLSSPSAVQECFTKNDIVFANRPPLLISKYLNYNCTTLVATNYGEHWRNLRRISAIEIFSSARLRTFRGIREDEVKILLRKLYHASKHGFSKVGLRSVLMDMTYNSIMRMVAGKRYYGEDVEDVEGAREFKGIIREYTKYAGMANLGDCFPVLERLIGCNGFVKKLVKLSNRMDLFMQNLIEEHRANYKDGNTMIDHLLALQESQPEYYTDGIIKGFILELINMDEFAAVTMSKVEPLEAMCRARQNLDKLLS
ncbi:hypothetical protein Tsubulata_051334, partial [Turnera subulata]